jgi:DNA repair protein RadC
MQSNLSFPSQQLTQFFIRSPEGEYRVPTTPEIVAQAYQLIAQKFDRINITGSDSACDYLVMRYALEPREFFGLMLVDTQHNLIEVRELYQGNVSSVDIQPRELVKAALQCNATGALMFHNHPSGNPYPSNADLRFTREAEKALALVGVKVLDHLIVGGASAISLVEKGLFTPGCK